MSTEARTGRFTGKTVIVTGAGSGIGEATAVRVAQEGGRVIATDVDAERLKKLAENLTGLDLHTVTGDITDLVTTDAITAIADGRIDALANIAGIMDGFLPPTEVDDATWDRVLAVNLTGPMRLTRAALPIMISAGGGAVVNVASEAALRASTSGAAYTASKHALVGYTKSVAFFHGPQGIRANVIVPGPVATNIQASMRSAAAAGRVRPVLQATMPTPAQPSHLAAAITWLLSDDSANINGAVLPSDGGWSAT